MSLNAMLRGTSTLHHFASMDVDWRLLQKG